MEPFSVDVEGYPGLGHMDCSPWEQKNRYSQRLCLKQLGQMGRVAEGCCLEVESNSHLEEHMDRSLPLVNSGYFYRP